MSVVIGFKNYARGPRLQTIETLYNKGMNFTNKPVMEGFSRVLVNFDIGSDGMSLTPRPGLRNLIYEVGTTEVDHYSYGANVLGTKQIVASAEYTLSDLSKTYQHNILGELSGAVVDDTQLSRGKLYRALTEEIPKPLETLETLTELTSEDTFAYFRTPISASIHSIPVDVDSPAIEHIGTFAFGQGYFYFKETVIGEVTSYGLYQSRYDDNVVPKHFTDEIVTPDYINPSSATMGGYNMLLATPYKFDQVWNSGTCEILGVLPYKESTCVNLEMTPTDNQQIYFKCIVNADISSTKISKVVWSWGSQAATDLRVFKTSIIPTVDADHGFIEAACIASLKVPLQDIAIKVELTYGPVDGGSTIIVTDWAHLNYDKSRFLSGTGYKDPKVYNLALATGMSYWKNRLVLYGVPGDATLLFLSAVDNPGYFPYPNSIATFDEPIVHVEPLLDSLLVFTTTQLHMVTIGVGDGVVVTRLTQKCIQRNLRINAWDTHLIQAVKNMVFFKSGNYYYMVVPSARSLTGELVIAPISKNIELFLDNFKENVYNIMETVYNYTKEMQLVHYYNFLDFEDICNVYVFKTQEDTYIHFGLIYNSLTRIWRIHIYECQGMLRPISNDSTKRGTYGIITPDDLYYLAFDKENIEDENAINIQNFQMYDTGYREHSSNTKKRYRELQIVINNTSGKQLDFYTEFYIDGSTRKDMYRYTTESVTMGDYISELVVKREYYEPSVIPGTTVLDFWKLNESVFPEQSIWKIRIPVSGKGYAPRMVFVSHNLEKFEIINNSYVYRTLSSR